MESREVSARLILKDQLKNLKKVLPKACTFLSAITLSNGQLAVRAIVKGEEHVFATPPEIYYDSAGLRRLQDLIVKYC
jgi:hypothetical protein